MRLKITNETNSQEYIKDFNNYTDCRHWIINHLDLSLRWSAEDITEGLI